MHAATCSVNYHHTQVMLNLASTLSVACRSLVFLLGDAAHTYTVMLQSKAEFYFLFAVSWLAEIPSSIVYLQIRSNFALTKMQLHVDIYCPVKNALCAPEASQTWLAFLTQ
jgi:hypothetical protein